MAKITLLRVANLTNQRSVCAAINENMTRLETAFENTLSLDGSTPNQLEADLDLNGNTLDDAVLGENVVVS